ncbi:translation initiation factor [Silvanigrella aquatica]|uniref:SUI1 domain-containing protein n=1 Tax=Silvanigrella aquatica TaxID=1915309 RepID=A0A1L4D444_9BACT|nr:translation initiation factor [Silvanigrella aquatica]APJ04937.1 hypothetical protein AXG55_13945 [Silvanigrella aquatica]
MSEKKKSKPIKLEWQGGLASLHEEAPIALRGADTPASSPPQKLPIGEIQGKVSIRKESKGRAGKPVAILFNFADDLAKNPENLKTLCSKLKTTLACGGTVENGEIILILRNFEKLKEILLKLNLIAK